jgi:acetylornithine deacetylase
VLPRMHAVDAGTGVETQARAVVPGLAPEDGSPAEALVLALARKNTTGVVAYGTEAGQFQEAGNPVVVCGPGSIAQAHKPNEFIALSEVRACEAFMGRLLDEVCAA